MQAEIDEAVNLLENVDLVADIDKVRMQALMNPDILSKIFCSLDAPTLKSARLVCTTWADEGASFLGKLGRLTFSTTHNRYHTWCKDLTLFNHKLAKNVELYMKCNCSPSFRHSPSEVDSNRKLPPNFALSLPEISVILETIDIDVTSPLKPNLHPMWSTHFPNLTVVSITIEKLDSNHVMTADEETRQEFRPLPKLRVLSITSRHDSFKSSLDVPSSFQGLLNSAPNLEELNLDANSYPDLTQCPKLKKLMYTYQARGVYRAELLPVDISEMTRMLETCQNSLEKLTLKRSGYVDNPSIKLNFHFPNLTHLAIINDSNLFEIEDSLNITNLPRLTHFSIGGGDHYQYYQISSMIATLHTRHVGITSLNVKSTHNSNSWSRDGQAAVKLVNLFPAVNELKLSLSVDFVRDGEADFRPLKEVMQSLGEWGLTSGKVVVGCLPVSFAEDYEYQFSGRLWDPSLDIDSDVVMTVLEGMKEWRGLENTSLKFYGNFNGARLEASDRMREAFLSCSRLQSVTLEELEVHDHTEREEFHEFIRQNELPVTFTERE